MPDAGTETMLTVAAWWKGEGYGGSYVAKDRADAERYATLMLEHGYGNGTLGGGDEVRIVEVTTTWTAWRKPDAE
jgi:hypothetical protein